MFKLVKSSLLVFTVSLTLFVSMSFSQVARVSPRLSALESFNDYIVLIGDEREREGLIKEFYTEFNPNSPKLSTHLIVRDHVRLNYPEAYHVVEIADTSRAIGMVVDVYRNKFFEPGTQRRRWHREHVWPKSLGYVRNNRCNSPYTDCHALFAVYPPDNSSRRNKPFDFCRTDDCRQRPVENTTKQFFNLVNARVWETWDGRKGDVARACFYMAVRYMGSYNEILQCDEPNLILTDNLAQVVSHDENQPEGFMGKLSTLIQWHRMDPPSEQEMWRNDVVFYYQHNRNPFIDNPHWVEMIWGE